MILSVPFYNFNLLLARLRTSSPLALWSCTSMAESHQLGAVGQLKLSHSSLCGGRGAA